MEKRGFGAGARVCFAAAVRWVLRVAGAISLEKEPALSHRTRLGRDVQFEMGPAWSHRTRRRTREPVVGSGYWTCGRMGFGCGGSDLLRGRDER
jgi:hypothetical protein